MANLMWFQEEDVLQIPLLEPVDDLPIVSLTPKAVAMLLGEPQEAQVTAACPPRHEEWAAIPKDAAKLMGDSHRVPRNASVSTATTVIQTTATRIWATSA